MGVSLFALATLFRTQAFCPWDRGRLACDAGRDGRATVESIHCRPARYAFPDTGFLSLGSRASRLRRGQGWPRYSGIHMFLLSIAHTSRLTTYSPLSSGLILAAKPKRFMSLSIRVLLASTSPSSVLKPFSRAASCRPLIRRVPSP